MSVWRLQERFDRLGTAGKVGIGLLAVYGTYVGTQHVYGLYRRLVNNRIRHRKKAENDRSIEALRNRLKNDPISDKQVRYITDLSFVELSQELKDGKLRPIEVLRAYQVKALEAHQRLNCLVEPIAEAEEWALELEKGPREGALWGIPISIKDDIGIKGYDSTIGMIIKVGNPSKEDADVLQVLRKEGAIPFVKTNVPQTELSFEPGNPINGVVHNPHRHGYGPGGSSSGEAALIGSGGSLLGIGSDIGGSIRVPAHFCGVYGFKPTSERMSTRRMSLENEASISIRPAWGPLSRDMDGLVTTLQTFWKDGSMAKTDPETVPMPFNTKAYSDDSKLRVGYYVHNGLAPTFSACARAVDVAKTILSDMGHEVVPWSPPEPKYNFELALRILQADGGAKLREELMYDKVDKTMEPFSKGIFTPIWRRKLMSAIIRPLNPDGADRIQWSCGAGDVGSYNELNSKLWEQRRVIQDSWNQAGLDAVICPPHIIPAPPLGSSELILSTALFTVTYNILHFPAGVLPVTHVTNSDVDHLQEDFPPGNSVHDKIREAMADSVDLPVGVMVATPRYKDETCLRVMKILDDSLRKRKT